MQATHTLAHVQTWTGSSWFENTEDVIWECLPDLAFTNDNGEASLTDEWGNVLVTVAYSQCGHSSSKGASEGRSMECLFTSILHFQIPAQDCLLADFAQ